MVADYPRGKHQAGVILARKLPNITAARRLTRGNDFPRPARLKPGCLLMRPLPRRHDGAQYEHRPQQQADAQGDRKCCVLVASDAGGHLGARHPN